MTKLILVKLGGSVLSDTRKENTPKLRQINRLVKEIKQGSKGAMVVVGHGSGSFAHIPAHRYGLQKGLHNKMSRKGASITQEVAARLHTLVLRSMIKNGLDALSFRPAAGGMTSNGKLVQWNIEPLKRALESGFVPVTMGDVVIDAKKGIAVIPTEEALEYLAARLKPYKVIIGGDIDGVFTSNPMLHKDAKLIRNITRRNIRKAAAGAGASLKIDVTGGMSSKLSYLYNISKRYHTRCQIVNATVPGRLRDAMLGKNVIGTSIKA